MNAGMDCLSFIVSVWTAVKSYLPVSVRVPTNVIGGIPKMQIRYCQSSA